MAFHIMIEKTSECEREAVYRFYDTAFANEPGELKLDKVTGIIEMTVPTRETFFQRAAVKVARHYRDGDLPDRTEWAS